VPQSAIYLPLAINKLLYISKLEEAATQFMINKSLIMSHSSVSQIGLSSVIPKEWAINLFGERNSEEPLKNKINPLWLNPTAKA
jgi:hypothetical protein